MTLEKDKSPDRSPAYSTHGGRLPLHVQVSELLAREIQAGIIPDGERLAPERQMAAQMGIAVGTLRKALADLTEKGLLERVQGSGNYARNTKEARTIYGFFHLELIEGGGLPTAEILSVDRMIKPDDLPDFGTSREGFRIKRLRRLNGIDAALEEIWLDGSRAETIRTEDLRDSLYVFYRKKLNLWIFQATDSVSVAPVPAWQPDNFASRTSGPQAIWGYIERMSYDQKNVSAEFSRTWFDPQTTRFVARWN